MLTEEESEGYARAKALLAQGDSGGSSVLPKLAHAPGFTKYQRIEAGGLAHEAGYDAYMTASVFARMIPLVKAKSSSSLQELSDLNVADKSNDPLLPMRPYMGKLNTMKSDMPYTNLYGPDAPLVRPNVFFVSAAPPSIEPWLGSEEELRADDIQKLFQSVGLHQPRPKLTLWSPPLSGGGGVGGKGNALGWLVELDSSLSPLAAAKLMGEGNSTIVLSSGSKLGVRVVPWEQFATDKASILAAAESKAVRPAKRQRVEIEPEFAPVAMDKQAAVEEREKKVGCSIM